MSKRKKSVLVIDDDKSVLRTFRRILEKGGYDVEVAETGKEAMQKASEKGFDVALIDLRLPDMDGTELLVKAKESLHDAVKIMITGGPSADTGTKALDESVDVYLLKPVKPGDLLSLIADKIRTKKTAA